jgi:hypothetical protein
MEDDSYFILNSLYLGYVINRILNSSKFITEFIALVELNNIMPARGSHNIILFNPCNKFSIELTPIQYPLYNTSRPIAYRSPSFVKIVAIK